MGLRDHRSFPWQKSAHIKKGTHGSSNEISMSVLDAARNDLEAEHGEASRPKLGVISLFTLDRGKSSRVELPSSTLQADANVEPENQPIVAVDTAADERQEQREQERLLEHQRRKEERERAQKERERTRMERKEERERRKREEQRAAAHHANTSSKVASMPRKSMEENIARKKARRKRRRVLLVSFVVLVALFIAGASAYRVYEGYLGQLSQMDVVEKGLAQIVIADDDLTRLNSALETPSSESSQETLKELQEVLPQTQIALQRAQGLLDRASENLDSERDKEAVNQARKAISARNQMIESGLDLSDKILKAFESRQVVEGIWDELLQADAEARTNAELLLDPTDENLTAALAGIETAKVSFKDLQEKMSSAERAYSYINLDQYKTYIDKRLVALDDAKQAIEALQEEDLDTAREMQESYAQADSDAADWADKLPKQITSLVNDAYALDAKQVIEDYTTARTAAGGADDMLREYYGQRQK